MKYCPRCRAELALRSEGGRERLTCPDCSYVFFGHFSIGVGGVVVRDGKALLIQRGQNPFRGWWQIPGGYAEHDESLEVAVAREVFEETGVRAQPTNVIGIRHSLATAYAAPNVSSTNVYVIFRLEAEEGEQGDPCADGEETLSAGYFSLDEIARMEQVQNLTKWSLKAALSPGEGFARVDAPEMARPGYWLFGLPTPG